MEEIITAFRRYLILERNMSEQEADKEIEQLQTFLLFLELEEVKLQM